MKIEDGGIPLKYPPHNFIFQENTLKNQWAGGSKNVKILQKNGKPSSKINRVELKRPFFLNRGICFVFYVYSHSYIRVSGAPPFCHMPKLTAGD